MRDSAQRDNKILRNDDGTIIGISMAADYCAEHEWGIKALKRKLGLVEKPESFADNCLTKPFTLRTEDAGNFPMFITTSHSEYTDVTRLGTYWNSEGLDFTSAWDERDFFAKAVSEDGKAALTALVEAFERGDIAVFLGGGGVFQNAGLVVAINSLIPQELKDGYDAVCEDRRKIAAAAEATGIAQRIKDAGLRYYALSPKWTFESMQERTTHPVVFWLNPCDQHLYNSNWVTVEDLDAWIAGSGPIPKSAA